MPFFAFFAALFAVYATILGTGYWLGATGTIWGLLVGAAAVLAPFAAVAAALYVSEEE